MANFVQATSGVPPDQDTTFAPFSLSYVSNQVQGNCNIAAVISIYGSAFPDSISDSNGNSYTNVGNYSIWSGNDGWQAINLNVFVANNISAGANTVTIQAYGDVLVYSPFFLIAEYGLVSINPFNGIVGDVDDDTPNLTTSSAPSRLIGLGFAYDTAIGALSSSFTSRYSGSVTTGNDTLAWVLADRASPTRGPYSWGAANANVTALIGLQLASSVIDLYGIGTKQGFGKSALSLSYIVPPVTTLVPSVLTLSGFEEAYPNRIPEDIYDSLGSNPLFLFSSYGPPHPHP